MLVGIHQPHYLPWLRYFEKIARSDVFIALDNIQFSKNGWQNRNKVKGPNGPVLLTAPVHASLDGTIGATAIREDGKWRVKHAKTIEQLYRSAPHFDTYWPPLQALYAREWETLGALNRAMLTMWNDALGITTPVVYASDLAVPGEATERLINLVQAVGGDAYYSGAYALEAYLDGDRLAEAGIELVIQEWTAPVYPQRYGEFVKDLAVVDLLMNCGPDSLTILLGETP